MALRLRFPWLVDVALVSNPAEMAWLNNEPVIDRAFTGGGGWLNRLVARRVSEVLATPGGQRLPVFVRQGDRSRSDAQAALETDLTTRAGGAAPFDRDTVATLGRYVAGEDLDTPIGVTVQHIVGRLFDPAYEATRESYAAARVVASVVSACPITAIRALWWLRTGRFAESRDLIWKLAGNNPQAIHATGIAMHNIVESVERLRTLARKDGPWHLTPAEAAARGLVTPPALLRECRAPTGWKKPLPSLRRGTLVVFRLKAMHTGTASNDLALSREEWSECPAHALVPRLLADVWREAVAERSAQRYASRRPSILSRLFVRPLVRLFGRINRRVPWYRLPKLPRVVPYFLTPAFINLVVLRKVLRERNLHDTSLLPTTGSSPLPPAGPDVLRWRTADGSFNDLTDPSMGRAATRFGRNVPLGHTWPDTARLLEPNPRLVSRTLLTRKTFLPATGLNVLAAAWIQFQVHDWFNHETDNNAPPYEIELAPDDPWRRDPMMQGVMKIAPTRRDPTRADHPPIAAPTYINTVTHWWDASQVYGSDLPTQQRVRSGQDGKLTMAANRRLPLDPVTKIEITGFNSNWWLGLSLFHHVFALEHNAICDRLCAEYRDWDDERLFQTARLANAALIAKIHDLEWVKIMLDNAPVKKGLDAGWWGILGKWFATHVIRIPVLDLLTGIPGTRADHHAAPYAITEEFVSVYRMHAFMMPETFTVYRPTDGQPVTTMPLEDILGARAGTVLTQYGMEELLYSFARNVPGAIRLGNYAGALQQFRPVPGAPPIDVAAIDVFRDRERGVPRYNQFRELLHLPPIRTFEQLNRDWAPELRKLYGTMDRVDLMIGLFAEEPPSGFAFSDTTFRIFLLMNGRRRKSDRFHSTDYKASIYTQAGLDWVHENDMKSVLLRHYPALEPVLKNVPNVFAQWVK